MPSGSALYLIDSKISKCGRSYNQGWSQTGCWGCWLRIQQQFELGSEGGMQCWASSHSESHYNHGHGGWCSWSPAPPGQQNQRRQKMTEPELTLVTLYPTLVRVRTIGGLYEYYSNIHLQYNMACIIGVYIYKYSPIYK